MMESELQPLKELQDWYCAQCDGSWEHTYGISIVTIDNPGWHLKIDIVGTELAGKSFDELKFEGENRRDWYACKVTPAAFEAFCGPERLSTVIAEFVRWVGSQGSRAR